MPRGSVLVYRSKGASEAGCTHLLNALKTCLDPSKHTVDFVSADSFINPNGSVIENASLIAFGGGYTSGFEQALGKQGLASLRDYVLGGGSYLGLGAGGYFGCDYIQFDKGGPLEKFSERDLRFYPGTGIGPAYPGFKYLSNQGVHTAPVTFSSPPHGKHSTFDALIDGGGLFEPSHSVKPGSQVTQTEVLARFKELVGTPAAIVRSEVGKGKVVLSGVHLEYDVISMIDSDPDLEHFRERFEASVTEQQLAFRHILRLLDLDVLED